MFLDSKDIPDLQVLLTEPNNGAIEEIKNADISLSVSLFLAVKHRSFWLTGNRTTANAIARLGLAGVSNAINLLLAPVAPRCRDPLGAPTYDLYRIQSKDDLRCDDWLLYCDRFRRSAAGERNGTMFTGVSAVLGEMGDNVVWHAFAAENTPCPAIAGFHVANGMASFCVADAGQGFLNSLRRAPKWSDLKSDYDALDAVISKQATSRLGEDEGGGFKQLFNSLLDFNGLVVMRSGSSTFNLSNRGEDRELHSEHHTDVPGASVTAVFAKAGEPKEVPLENNS